MLQKTSKPMLQQLFHSIKQQHSPNTYNQMHHLCTLAGNRNVDIHSSTRKRSITWEATDKSNSHGKQQCLTKETCKLIHMGNQLTIYFCTNSQSRHAKSPLPSLKLLPLLQSTSASEQDKPRWYFLLLLDNSIFEKMSSSSVRVSLPGVLDPETFPDFLHDMLSVIYKRNIIANMTGRPRKGQYDKMGPMSQRHLMRKVIYMHRYN